MDEDVIRLRSSGLHWRRIEEEEVVALDLTSQEYLTLNRSATLLWEMMVAGCRRDELVSRLAAEYRLDRRRAEEDVDALLGQLAEQGLLQGDSVSGRG